LWDDHPKAYLAITLPDFPNFFMLNGPNGPVGNYSLIDIAEHQWHYIGQLLDKLQRGEAREICCKKQALERFIALHPSSPLTGQARKRLSEL
jgi:cation diffusion facilitator CzcD-associated flavoprotein CzcO